jgi:HJR/Mrr/RecB family endonuclease
MASRRHQNNLTGIMLVLLTLVVTAWAYRRAAVATIVVTFLLISAIFTLKRLLKCSRGFSTNIKLNYIDAMDGLTFERYVAKLLLRHGFEYVRVTEKFDKGVDIIAVKDGERWGIQVKRYNGLVKAAAVRQVVTALNFYGCSRAMVVTNSSYSNMAIQLAETNDCLLIDRKKLVKMIG